MPHTQQVAQAQTSNLEREIVEPFRGAIRYLEHGYPHPLVRWHYHDEYELHLIVASRGKAFVGDYIGEFQPGHLVLTGPRQPHNWISYTDLQKSFELRDMVVQFKHEAVFKAAESFPELASLLPFLDSAVYGIEFFGMGKRAEKAMQKIRDCSGVSRLTEFLLLMQELERCRYKKQLSSAKIDIHLDSSDQDTISKVVNYILHNYQSDISLQQVADLARMSPSHFSRFFSKATGNTFKEFFASIRISKACELLVHSDKQITSICYDVGYNNIANFNRRFLERKKVSPSTYRKEAQARLTRGGS